MLKIRNLIDRGAHTALYDVLKAFGSRAPRTTPGYPQNCVMEIEGPQEIVIHDRVSEFMGRDPVTFHWEAPGVNVYSFDHALLAGKSGFIYNPEGNRLYDCSFPIADNKIRRPIKFLSKKFKEEGVRYFHFMGENLYNRAHFILEHAPRLLLGINNIITEKHKILVINSFPNWYKEYMHFFGINIHNCMETSLGTNEVHNLDYIPNPCGKKINYSINTYQAMCKHLNKCRTEMTNNTESYTNVIWISRSDSPRRSMTNENELINIWSEIFGPPRVITLSNMPIEHQLKEISTATCIIAQMGQSLNLLPFITSKIVIMIDQMELDSAPGWNDAFFTMSEFSKNFMIRLFSDKSENFGDWSYPSDKFRAELERLKSLSEKDKFLSIVPENCIEPLRKCFRVQTARPPRGATSK